MVFSYRFQEIIGFGGSWSDAAAIGLDRLTPDLRTKVLRSYYSEEGIEYSTARVVISGCDFSNRPYSYDDINDDWELGNWSLVEEDTNMKVSLRNLIEVDLRYLYYFCGRFHKCKKQFALQANP